MFRISLFLLACFFFQNLPGQLNTASILPNDVRYAIVEDKEGIRVQAFDFPARSTYAPRNTWNAKWIWLPQDAFPNYQTARSEWINSQTPARYHVLFRKSFDLNTLPGEIYLYVTADVSFRLFINGTLVCQGPANIGSDYLDTQPPTHWLYTVHTVKKYLQRGKNVIAVEVSAYDKALSETSSGAGGFLGELVNEGGEPLLASNEEWKCMLDTCYKQYKGMMQYDARNRPVDWNSLLYNDTQWPQAEIKQKPYHTYLLQSNIPLSILHEVFPIDPTTGLNNATIRMIDLPNGYKRQEQLFSFERLMPAYIRFSLRAQSGDTVEIYPFEKNVHDYNRPLRYICREGNNTFETPYLSSFKYVNVVLKSKGQYPLDSLSALYSTYPVQYRGDFSCSDEFFTRLWKICRSSTQLCMNDMFYDSPRHQEPLACTGDYLISALSNYYAFGDKLLPRQDLFKTAKFLEKNGYDMFHTSYSLLWVQMIRDYVRFSQDSAFLPVILPYVNKLLTVFESYLDDNFLLSNAPDYMFMDWITIDGFNAHHPPAHIGMGYLSAFYYKALIDAAYLNQRANNASESEKQMARAEKIKQGIENMLWDKEKKLYKDGIPYLSKRTPHTWLPSDKKSTTYSPHVNTLCVLYDIAPKERHHSLLKYALTQQEIQLQPYFTYFVLSAIRHIQSVDSLGFALLKKWENGIDTTTETLKENWNDETDFGYKGDYSHAWGGSPLSFLSQNVLGIFPDDTKANTFVFKPYYGSHLSWAKGKVPLIRGEAEIAWRREKDDFVYELNIPKGIPLLLDVSAFPDTYTVKINGRTTDATEKEILLKGRKQIQLLSKK